MFDDFCPSEKSPTDELIFPGNESSLSDGAAKELP